MITIQKNISGKRRKRERKGGGGKDWVGLGFHYLSVSINMTYARTLPGLSYTYLSIYDWQDLFLYLFMSHLPWPSSSNPHHLAYIKVLP